MFLLIGGNFYPCLMQKAWGELPVFEVMVWQQCNLLRPSLNYFCLLQCVIQESWLQRTVVRKKLPKTSKNFPPIFKSVQIARNKRLSYWFTVLYA